MQEKWLPRLAWTNLIPPSFASTGRRQGGLDKGYCVSIQHHPAIRDKMDKGAEGSKVREQMSSRNRTSKGAEVRETPWVLRFTRGS